MRLISVFLSVLLLLSLLSCSHSRVQEGSAREPAFTSKSATEALLNFSHFVEIESDTRPTLAEAKMQVEMQVLHLFGPMERVNYVAAPKEDHTIRITSISENPIRTHPNVYLISYDYQDGTIVLKSGPRKYYEIYLPRNPDTIYEQAGGPHNKCTDEHYWTEEDFWYFWGPSEVQERSRCKLKKGRDYDVIKANITRLERSDTRYPDYRRLPNKDGVIDIHIYFGMDSPLGTFKETGSRSRKAYRERLAQYQNPNTSEDVNAENYRIIKKELIENHGFEFAQPWGRKDLARIVKLNNAERAPYVEEGIKEFPNRGVKLRLRLFFGETGIAERSRAFHYLMRDSMRNSSVFIYDGHSGLGSHLDFKQISQLYNFKISPNKDRYQIFFFNSCTSYTYYNAMYFHKKRTFAKKGKVSTRGVDEKGTKNLDIMANGLATMFDVMKSTNMALINAIALWAYRGQATSYQTLAERIDSDNLFTVNGDEDNPTTEDVRSW